MKLRRCGHAGQRGMQSRKALPEVEFESGPDGLRISRGHRVDDCLVVVQAGALASLFGIEQIEMRADQHPAFADLGPHLFQLVTGVKNGASSTGATLLYLKSLLPAGCQRSAFGLGR